MPDYRADAKFWRDMAERIRRERIPTDQFLRMLVDNPAVQTPKAKGMNDMLRKSIGLDSSPTHAARLCDTVADLYEKLADLPNG